MAFFRSHREKVEKSEFESKPLELKTKQKPCLGRFSPYHCLRTQPREAGRTESGFRVPPIPRRVVLGKSLNLAGPQLPEAGAGWLHITKTALPAWPFFLLPRLWSSLWPLACPSKALHIVTDTVRELLLGAGPHQPVVVTGTPREMACN